MDLRESARDLGTINENIKSVWLPAVSSTRWAPCTITNIERAPTAVLIASVQLSQRLTDRWWFRRYSLARSRHSNWNIYTRSIRKMYVSFAD